MSEIDHEKDPVIAPEQLGTPGTSNTQRLTSPDLDQNDRNGIGRTTEIWTSDAGLDEGGHVADTGRDDVGRDTGQDDVGRDTGQDDAGPYDTEQYDAGRYGGSDDHEAIDADFIPRVPWRPNAVSLALVGLAIIGAGFIAGVLTQKHHDKGITSSAAAARTGLARGAFAGGFGGAGFGAGAGVGGGAGGIGTTGTGTSGTGTSGTGTSGTGTNGSAASLGVPVVIGTLTSITGTQAVVTNLGGAKISVRLSHSTLITAPFGSAALKTGATVSVYGSRNAAGAVSATSITMTS